MNRAYEKYGGGLSESYLRDLSRYPPLSEEEFERLIVRAQQGDREAFQQAVQANLRFVVQIAREYHTPHLSLDELVAEGNLGLIRAVERFNPNKGYKFTTYAVWWIRQAIRKALQAQKQPVRLPTNQLEDMERIRRSDERLAQRIGRNTSVEEMADELDMTPRRVQAALNTQKRQVSLDASAGDDDEASYHNFFADPAMLPDEALIRQDLGEKVQEAVRSLDPRDAEVISMTFGLEGEPMTLKQAGKRLGVTRERVRQLRNRALSQLRKKLSELDDSEDETEGEEVPAG